MPRTTEAIEQVRLREQNRLDALRGADERNRSGQFATPPALARSIVEYALELWKPRGRKCRFLEPAVGTGAFLCAFRQVFPRELVGGALGVELDSEFASVARSLWLIPDTAVIEGDFTKLEPPSEPFDLIMTNPPYVRHHHLAREDKVRLQGLVSRYLHTSISGLAGLYCYFLLLAHRWLADEGISIWLIPSEFMDVNYGAALRRYLTERVTLLRIHRFCPSDVQFADALVSSAVVVFQKTLPRADHCATFSFGGSLQEPECEQAVPIAELKRNRKWTRYPHATSPAENREICLGDLFAIKRGLATGSNSFFIITPERAREIGVPRECLRPILPSPRFLTATIIEADADGYPRIDKKYCLIDCDYPETRIKAEMPGFWAYLMQGKSTGIADRYLTSKRSPWYSQEHRPPAPFLCTYMGRCSNGSGPFRFLWNKSQAIATNVYLMLYPRSSLQQVLRESPDLASAVFGVLQGFDARSLMNEGRVYGGGLHKVEPRELARLPASAFTEAIAQLEEGRQLVFAF